MDKDKAFDFLVSFLAGNSCHDSHDCPRGYTFDDCEKCWLEWLEKEFPDES